LGVPWQGARRHRLSLTTEQRSGSPISGSMHLVEIRDATELESLRSAWAAL
jgi:hypothetical protein